MRVIVYVVTQRGSVGGAQERTSKSMDDRRNSGVCGAEGGPRRMYFSLVRCHINPCIAIHIEVHVDYKENLPCTIMVMLAICCSVGGGERTMVFTQVKTVPL